MFLPKSASLRVVARLLWFGALLIGVLLLLPVPLTDRLLSAHGPLQVITTLLLAAGAVFAFSRYAKTKESTALGAAWVLALFAWVKFDPGDWLLNHEADHPAFYLDAGVSVLERIALAGLLGSGVILAGVLLVRLFPRFLAGWQRREPISVWGGSAVMLLALSFVLDFFHGRMTWERGFRDEGQWPKHQVNVLEETLELLVAVLFVLAALAAARRGAAAARGGPPEEVT